MLNFVVLKNSTMTLQYQVTGMTCAKCESKVKSALLALPFVSEVSVSKEMESATITMDKHLAFKEIESAVSAAGNYKISESNQKDFVSHQNLWVTYKPLLLIVAYIILISVIIPIANGDFDSMNWMRNFMAAFFIVFSFFKLLDLKGFASSYQMYDVVAIKFPVWAFIYPFIELTLGLSYALDLNPLYTNIATLTVMSLSIVGVIKSVISKSKIRCACLGSIFNLPMTTVTIVEDGLMILMSVAMLILI